MLALQHIIPKELRYTVHLPQSKSILNRVLMIRALAGLMSEETQAGESNDALVLSRALQQKTATIDMEDTGTGLRFYIAYAALKGISLWITGDPGLRNRPLQPLLSALEALGAVFEYADQKQQLPLRVIRALDLHQNEVQIDAAASSQFVSALMLIAPFFRQGLEIRITGERSSAPYIGMTAFCMARAGVQVRDLGYAIRTGNGEYRVQGLESEADWSSACFVYAWVALSKRIQIALPGLVLPSAQGDSEAVNIFRQFGVLTRREGELLVLENQGPVCSAFSASLSDTPDMFPVLAALCAVLRIPARFTGVANLRLKESDRIAAMRYNLLQTGALLSETEPGVVQLSFTGACEYPLHFKVFADHRIAMACSLFAFGGDVFIDDENRVEKSFPAYWNEFRKLFYE